MNPDIRRLTREETSQAVQLADRIFRDHEQVSMQSGFPYLYSQTYAHSFGVFQQNQLVAFMGLLPSVVHSGPATLTTFSLGSVCTHPDARGHGYASQMLAEIQQHIDRAGASLLFVSGTRSLYRRAECHPFGDVKRFELKPEHAAFIRAQATSISCRQADAYDQFRIHELARSRSVRFDQSLWDLAGLASAEAYATCAKLKQSMFVAERNGEIIAFLAAALPQGLQSKQPPFAVEWAGDAEAIVGLLAYAMESGRANSLNIPVSWHELELLDRLNAIADTAIRAERNLGTIYIVNAKRLLHQLRPFLRAQDPALGEQLQIDKHEKTGSYKLSLPALPELLLTAEELVSVLFQPNSEYKVPNEWESAAAKLFPIPLPYTGGLNYI